MKKILLIGMISLLSLRGMSQFVPNSSQGFQFAPLYNPAFTGIEGYRDLKLGYRYQWTGFGSEAPKFINVSLNLRIKEPLDLTLNAIRTSMAKAQNREIPKMKRSIHGLGVNFFNEKIGLINRTGGGLNYSFHYPFSKNMRMAIGLSAMLDNTKIDVDKIYLGINPDEPDELYNNLVSKGANHTDLNIRMGVLFYSSRLYFGVSYLPIMNTAIKTSPADISEPYYRGVIQGGYSFPISATMDVKPSILALLQMDNKFIIDYNVKLYVEEKIWFGLTYRDVKSMVGIVGFNLNERLGASYSYELSANKMRQFSDGSHDLVLSVRLNNFKRQKQQTW